MNPDELQIYLNGIFSQESDLSHGEKEIILKLIDSTIRYRDELLRNTGETLTVEETQMALNIYRSVIKTGKIPVNIEKKIGHGHHSEFF